MDTVVLFSCQLLVAETNINKVVEVYIVNLAFLHLVTWLFLCVGSSFSFTCICPRTISLRIIRRIFCV
jgi:hypothetical protein